MSGVRLPDEAVSLPAALLVAGAGAAIGSLWAVPDAPTALLMARFYQLWQAEGHGPQEALRLARDLAAGARQTPNMLAASPLWTGAGHGLFPMTFGSGNPAAATHTPTAGRFVLTGCGTCSAVRLRLIRPVRKTPSHIRQRLHGRALR